MLHFQPRFALLAALIFGGCADGQPAPGTALPKAKEHPTNYDLPKSDPASIAVSVGKMTPVAKREIELSGAPKWPETAQNIVFPADSNVADVSKAPYNADPTGKTDSTDAIQMALTGRKKIVYLPNGTYLISNTLRWGGERPSRQILQGQSTEKTILKLKDSAPGFNDPSNPREMVWTGKAPEQRFRTGLRNLTIDAGKDNPGVIGVRFYANNVGGVHDLRIRSGDGQGAIGLDMGYTRGHGPCLARRIRVEGFDIGIHTNGGTAGVVAEHIELVGQNKVGWSNTSQLISIHGLRSQNAVSALVNTGTALLTLINSTLEGKGGAMAIENEAAVFARNVVTSGYKLAIGGKNATTGTTISEWSSNAPLSLFASPPRSLNLPIKETPDVPWDDPKSWVSVAKFAPRKVTVDKMIRKTMRKVEVTDWSQAFQQAIDSGATTVYFPTGDYPMNGEIVLRGAVRRLIGLDSTFGGQNAHWKMSIEDGTAPVVRIERFDWMYDEMHVRCNTKRTLVFSNIMGGHDTRVETAPGSGEIFIEDMALPHFEFRGGTIWARQFNPESGYGPTPLVPRGTYVKSYDMVLNDGATVWVLGLKTEGDGTPFINQNNARLEILGGMIYANKNYRSRKQWFVNNESALSFSLTENVIRKEPFDPVVEIRGGKSRVLAEGEAPGRGGGSMVALYSGFQFAADKAPAAPQNLNAKTIGTGQISLNWSGANGADGLAVETQSEGDWKQLAVAPGEAQTLEISGLKPATTYKLRLKAFNGAGEAISSTIEAKTAAPPPPGAGTGLLTTYYGSKYMTGPKLVGAQTPDFDWSTIAPEGFKIGDFGARFVGEIEPRFSEETTFRIQNAGARLWVGGELVIDAWLPTSRTRAGKIALQSGKRVPIKFEFQGLKGAQAILNWQSDSLPLEIVPTSQLFAASAPQSEISLSAGGTKVQEGKTIALVVKKSGNGGPNEFEYSLDGSAVSGQEFTALPPKLSPGALVLQTLDDKNGEPTKTVAILLAPGPDFNVAGGPLQLQITDDDSPPAGNGSGLKGEYFADEAFAKPLVTRTDAQIDFKWDKNAPVEGQNPTEGYGIRWSGEIQPLFSGEFEFVVTATPYGRQKLTINGQVLVEAIGKTADRRGKITLQAGKKVPISIEFTNKRAYGALMKLIWKSDQQFEQVVPKSQLYPTP